MGTLMFYERPNLLKYVSERAETHRLSYLKYLFFLNFKSVFMCLSCKQYVHILCNHSFLHFFSLISV